jgi:hypothetical protein
VRAVPSRSVLSTTAVRALFVALLGTISFLPGWAVAVTPAASAAAAAGAETAAAPRPAAAVGRAAAAMGSGATVLGASGVRGPAVLADRASDDDGGPALGTPWAVLAAVLAAGVLASWLLSGPAAVRSLTRRARANRRDRAPPAWLAPTYA